MLHGGLVHAQGHRGTAFRVRDEQRPCLIDTIAPLRDIVTVEPAARLVGTILLHQLTLAAHRLLTVFPCVIEIRQVDAKANRGTDHTHRSSLQETGHLLLLHSFHQPGYYQCQDDEQVVVGHLHMVGVDLKSGKHRCQEQAPQILTPVGQYQTGNQRRQVGQGPYLPDMTGSDDNQEIG